MTSKKWRTIQAFQCPCGYEYEPVKGDSGQGWGPGTPYEDLPEFGTCPNCQRAKIHFRKKEYSVPAEENE